MRKFPVFGLTGCIGSGKSTAADMLQQLNYAIVDSDDLAREVVEPNSAGLYELVTEFGDKILNLDGSLNRKELGGIIFKDPKKRETAEKILHPKIRSTWLRKLKILTEQSPAKAAVYVVPLLFESKISYSEIISVIAISSPVEICVKRAMARSKLTENEVMERLSSQFSNDIKCSRSDYVIDNSGSTSQLSLLIKRLDELLTFRFRMS